MSALGHWLEAAVIASLPAYLQRGDGCMQFIPTPTGIARGKLYRKQSTVDFVGVFKAMPVAFDAKVTVAASLRHSNTHPHQLKFLRAFSNAGGFAGLLVAFDERGDGSFMIDVRCYDDLVDELDHRVSIPLSRFQLAADRPEEHCYHIAHGAGGVPIPLHQALDQARIRWGARFA